MKRHSVRQNVRGVIGLFLLTIYQLIFRQRFFLITMFVTSVSDNPLKHRLDLGWWNVFRFKLIYLLRFVLRRQHAFGNWFRRVESATVCRLNAAAQEGAAKGAAVKEYTAQEIVPLPELLAEDYEPESFYRNYVLKGQPVVIRGAALNTTALQTWDEGWLESLRDVELNIGDNESNREIRGTLGQALDSRGSDRRLYIYGATNIMRDRPELIDELGVHDYKAALARGILGHVGTQLFVGVHKHTGVGWHCAIGNNLFFQIRGKKHWKFAHPDYTWMLYPLLNKTCQTLLSPVGLVPHRNFTPEYLREHFPLALHLPQYEVTLEPGDVLFNPAWYWHSVDNVTEVTVAVSSRWMSPPTVSFNRLMEAFMMFSGVLTRRKFQVLRDMSFEMTDENSREIYRSMDDRIDFGRPGSANEFVQQTKMEELAPIEESYA